MESLSHTVGSRIRSYRLQKGLTQEALAEKAELHQTYIGQVERGEKNLTLASLEKILAALNVTFAEFFENIEGCKARAGLSTLCYQLISSHTSSEQAHIYKLLLELEALMG